MRVPFGDGAHLVVLAAVFASALGLFLIVRAAVVPAGFGRYGHYRAPAIDDIRARPVKFAGQAMCISCHVDVADTRSRSKHVRVSCEACHGPQNVHAEDPGNIKPTLAQDVTTLCSRCHEADRAKPRHFPQVKTSEHSGGAPCNTCHQPHSPKI